MGVAMIAVAVMVFYFSIPLWWPWFWAYTFAQAKLPPADRMFCSMVMDLMQEDGWEKLGYGCFKHTDSGIVLDQGYNRAAFSGPIPPRKFEGWLPVTFAAKRLSKRLEVRRDEQEAKTALEGLTSTFRRMNSK